MSRQTLFPADVIAVLTANNAASAAAIAKDGNTPDHVPVLKLFTPRGGATWLLSEYDPEDEKFFGLCDLGMGEPELGYVSRAELEATAYANVVQLIERDEYWQPTHPLSVYARAAMRAGRITQDRADLQAATREDGR